MVFLVGLVTVAKLINNKKTVYIYVTLLYAFRNILKFENQIDGNSGVPFVKFYSSAPASLDMSRAYPVARSKAASARACGKRTVNQAIGRLTRF